MKRFGLLRLLVVLIPAAGLTACGSSLPPAAQTAAGQAPADLPNIPQIEAAIAQTIRTYDHVAATVLCPAQVPQIPGETFSCIAVAHRPDVRTFTYTVTVQNGAHVTYRGSG